MSQQFIMVVLCVLGWFASHHLESVCEISESGANVAGEREGVRILGLPRAGGVDHVEGGEESAEVWAAARLVLGFGGGDIVFNWSGC